MPSRAARGRPPSRDATTGQITVADSSQLDYEAHTSRTLQVTVTDGGTPGLSASATVTVNLLNVNEVPTITAIADRTILEAGNTGAIPFTVGDPETADGTLLVTAVSSNPSLIPNANLVITGSGADKNITVTPLVGQTGGPVTITVTVSDGTLQTQETFDVTVVPRVIVVTTASDENDGDTTNILTLLATPGGSGISLREAIIATNNTANLSTPDLIQFNIPGAGPHTINVTSALPTITEAVIIDGWSEPDYAGTPVIELNGTSAGAGVDGLRVTAGGTTIRGLVLNRFSGDGIELNGSSGNIIQGNYLGTNVAGTADRGNGLDGLRIDNSADNLIGGLTPAERNVISGNNLHGVRIHGRFGRQQPHSRQLHRA